MSGTHTTYNKTNIGFELIYANYQFEKLQKWKMNLTVNLMMGYSRTVSVKSVSGSCLMNRNGNFRDF